MKLTTKHLKQLIKEEMEEEETQPDVEKIGSFFDKIDRWPEYEQLIKKVIFLAQNVDRSKEILIKLHKELPGHIDKMD
tara:strand:- start:310 stop:543 length:234 start_codon:yes stop_codon:yes gene_type:complete